MTLQEEINIRSKEVFAEAYSMSVGELMNLYSNDELDIHPEFQRFFRWDIEQKSKLIESLLLGIPIPSIFVSQRDDGVWDVIDGLQRLSTIFEFSGILKNENGKLFPMSSLSKTPYLPSLENKKYEDDTDPTNSFTISQRLLLKRSKFDLKILKQSSDPHLKYELFQRINSLGTQLSPQEIRNCLLIMADKSFFEWVLKLSKDSDFQNCTSLCGSDLDERSDIELVLRFFIFKNVDLSNISSDWKNISDFISEIAIEMSDPLNLNRDAEEEIFKKTFQILNKTLAEDSFRRYNFNKNKFEGMFMVTAFEAISIGIGSNIDDWYCHYEDGDLIEKLKEKSKELWRNEEFSRATGRGSRWNTRARTIVPIGKQIFQYN